ncbi:MAG: hypothetical protein JEZ12_13170 [Desulfobacterium sp.]|nr:hypothetical protein [Desulfobacterium sp.]
MVKMQLVMNWLYSDAEGIISTNEFATVLAGRCSFSLRIASEAPDGVEVTEIEEKWDVRGEKMTLTALDSDLNIIGKGGILVFTHKVKPLPTHKKHLYKLIIETPEGGGDVNTTEILFYSTLESDFLPESSTIAEVVDEFDIYDQDTDTLDVVRAPGIIDFDEKYSE